MNFKDFTIKEMSPPIYGTKQPKPYSYELLKHNKSGGGFVIGYLEWDDEGFNFRSCGTRYLTHRTAGLEKWLLAWCELKTIEIKYEQEEEEE